MCGILCVLSMADQRSTNEGAAGIAVEDLSEIIRNGVFLVCEVELSVDKIGTRGQSDPMVERPSLKTCTMAHGEGRWR